MMFSNLIENSRAHGASRVDLEMSKTSTHLHLSVRDNGSGISHANHDKVFDLFFTTRRDEGGTGMGMGIVQSIVHSHDGTIWLAECSSGAQFEISLPLA